jgi:hypothetical protein
MRVVKIEAVYQHAVHHRGIAQRETPAVADHGRRSAAELGECRQRHTRIRITTRRYGDADSVENQVLGARLDSARNIAQLQTLTETRVLIGERDGWIK